MSGSERSGGGGRSMADPKGFLKHGREVAERRPVEERVHDWNEVYPGGMGRALLPIITEQAGRCMDCGIPFCHQGCPLGQHHPGVERPGLARRLGGRDRAPARDQQLPGVHRSAVPGALRDRLRAGHQPGPGDDQERRGLDHRQGLGAGQRPPPAAGVALGPHGRGDRLRPGRPGRRPAADPRRPHGRGLRARRQDRRAAALRHPRVQDGEEAPRPAPRADAPRGHRLPRRRRGGRRRPHRGRAARPVRRGRAGHGRHRRPATCRSPGASSAASTRRWSSCRRPTGPRSARRSRTRSPRPASTSSSSAAATPAPTASAPPPARARASITQLEIMPEPPESRPAGQPWPTYPMTFRVSSAHEEAGERVYAVSTQEFLGDEDGNVRALRLVEVRFEDGSWSRSRAPSARSRPSWCSSRWASPGPRGRAWSSSSGVDLDERGNVARDASYMSSVRGCLRRRRRGPRPVADRVGDRRGPRRGGRRRRLPHRLDDAAVADPADRAPAGGLSVAAARGAEGGAGCLERSRIR